MDQTCETFVRGILLLFNPVSGNLGQLQFQYPSLDSIVLSLVLYASAVTAERRYDSENLAPNSNESTSGKFLAQYDFCQ